MHNQSEVNGKKKIPPAKEEITFIFCLNKPGLFVRWPLSAKEREPSHTLAWIGLGAQLSQEGLPLHEVGPVAVWTKLRVLGWLHLSQVFTVRTPRQGSEAC